MVKFSNHARRGFQRYAGEPAAENGLPLQGRLSLQLSVEVAGLTASVDHEIALIAPSDIAGLQGGQILRREPQAGAAGFEYNYFPFVEFSDPGLPWRFTPAAPNANGALSPWLVLAAVPDRPPNRVAPGPSGTTTLTIGEAASSVLPIPSEAWLWAHVQEGGTAETSISRLLCPTRLLPDTAYIAALVPLFEGGRAAGLGLAPNPATAGQPAWGDSTAAVTLPVYDHWRFTTGQDDFEALADKLSPAPPPATLGRKAMDISAPAPGLDLEDLGLDPDHGKLAGRMFAGALVARGVDEKPWEEAHKEPFQERLREILLDALPAPRRPSSGGYDPLRDDPAIGPPAYGSWQSRQAPVNATWAEELNLDPRHRAAAGLGARAFRRNQERYMALAWEAVAEAREATRQARRMRAASHVNSQVQGRIAKLPKPVQIQVLRPAHGKIRQAPDLPSLDALLDADAAVPNGSYDTAFARFGAARAAAVLPVAPPGDDSAPLDVTGGFVAAALQGSLPLDSFEALDVESTRITDYEIELSLPSGASGSLGQLSNGQAVLLDRNVTSRPPIAGAGPVTVQSIGTALGATAKFRRQSIALPFTAAPRSATDPLSQTLDAVDEIIEPVQRIAVRFEARVAKGALRGVTKVPVPKDVGQAIKFDTAAIEDIASAAPEAVVPGVSALPLNGVGMVESNPEFAAAYLAGMNHEAAREFAWRVFPTPLWHTWFNRFWKHAVPDAADIPPIGHWEEGWSLSDCLIDGAAKTVIATRAELLQRHPDTLVYAVPAHFDRRRRRRVVRAQELRNAKPPAFSGWLGRGIRYFGFDLPAEDMIGGADRGNVANAPGWFIAFEEPLFAPRFGLDAAKGFRDGGAPTSVNGLHWGDFAPDQAALDALPQAPAAPAWASEPVEGFTWGRSAADIAAMTWQRPVRVLIHADRLVRS